MTTKSEEKKTSSVPSWLLPALVSVLIGVSSWTLKAVIDLQLAVAVQTNIQQNVHDAVGDINNVLNSHSKMLSDHDGRLTRMETLITIQNKK